MTIRKSAYHTTATAGIVTKSILENASILHRDTLTESPEGVFALEGRTAFEKNIPSFIFPIVEDSGDDPRVFIDARPFGTFDDTRQRFVTRNLEQLEALRLHGGLALAWQHGRQNSILAMSTMPTGIFMTWIAEQLAKKLNLDGRSQYMVTILAGILYTNNFTNKVRPEGEQEQLLVNFFTRVLRYSDLSINQNLVKDHGDISDVHDFCKSCYEATQSASLKNLNPALLYSILGGSIWGSNPQEKLAVALEYPPTWIALLYQVVTDQSYRGKCVLSNIALRNTYNKDVTKGFVSSCLAIVDQHK